MNLALKYRPKIPDQILGQELVVARIKKWIAKKEIPHVVLLHGPTGTGKTTVARFLSQSLGVDPVEGNPNYTEQNCADCRGIDDIREIDNSIRFAALGGGVRVWVLDEVVQLPKATQQAALKMLEDTPGHVYFFLCTSDLETLLETLKGRCQPLSFRLLSMSALVTLVNKIALAELKSKGLRSDVAAKIAEAAEGSARMAIQLLETVLCFDNEAQQLEVLDAGSQATIAVDLARAVMYRKEWSYIANVIRTLSQPPETVRRIILAYCDSVMLNDKGRLSDRQRADVMIAYFRDAWSDCGRSGLITSCWRLTNAK